MSGSCPSRAAPELPENFSGDVALWLDEACRIGAVRVARGQECRPFWRDFTGALVRHGILELILVCDRPAFLKAVSDAVHGKREATVEFRLRAQEAAPFVWMEMRASRCSATGAVIGALRDMSDIRTTRHASAPMRTMAVPSSEEAADCRHRLLANVSHELRTPLNAIIGFSEMLATADLCPKNPEQQREYARIINASGQHLLSVVNTILDMSKIESGVFAIEPEHFDLAALIDFSCDLVKLKAQEKSIELLAARAPGLGEIVADKRACKQILLNLLSNAVKFTPEGGRVTVVARQDGAFLEINVSDTGIGVTPAELQRLGDPFYQARSTYDRPYEGAGLGLSIVRGLVALHGGAISFASAPNEGASVTVRLPMDCRHAERADARSARIETVSRREGAHKAGSIHSHHQVKKIA
jgi:cell cycle sensor histidine kinase DivJ